jgi:hypothetical protein
VEKALNTPFMCAVTDDNVDPNTTGTSSSTAVAFPMRSRAPDAYTEREKTRALWRI